MTSLPKAEPPKRKRRWFQFSLRSLMIFTLACAVACGWLGKKIEQKRRERETVAAIVKLGGRAHYDYQKISMGPQIVWRPIAEPYGPAWLRKVLGENFFSDVEEVSFQGCANVTDADLAKLKGLTNLHILDLAGTKVSDAGVAHLRGLVQLRELRLADDAHDAALEHLKGLTQLETLRLDGTNVSEVGLEHLKGLSRLRAVSLKGADVSDAGVDDLRKALPNCKIWH